MGTNACGRAEVLELCAPNKVLGGNLAPNGEDEGGKLGPEPAAEVAVVEVIVGVAAAVAGGVAKLNDEGAAWVVATGLLNCLMWPIKSPCSYFSLAAR